jgi:hypothetical protein
MKHIITAAVICAALATPALAEKHVAEHCEVIADLAEGLMGARQAGASLSAVMSIAAAEPQVRELVEAMILDAWSEPRWRTRRVAVARRGRLPRPDAPALPAGRMT